VTCGAHMFLLSNVLQSGLESAAVAAAAVVVVTPKFLKCNVSWGPGGQRFDSGWCFIST
jgi:hypothetical protein